MHPALSTPTELTLRSQLANQTSVAHPEQKMHIAPLHNPINLDLH